MRIKPIRYKASSSKPPLGEVSLLEAERLAEPEEQMGLIHGLTPGSAYEWNVAQALNFLGWGYAYQIPLEGGSTRRGGVILDFLVYTPPRETPISVKGGWWHRDSERDKLDEALIEQIYHAPVVSMGDNEAGTYDAAVEFLFMKIGRGAVSI